VARGVEPLVIARAGGEGQPATRGAGGSIGGGRITVAQLDHAAVYGAEAAAAGDEVDHAAGAAGAVEHRLRAAQNLYPLDIRGFQTGEDIFLAAAAEFDTIQQDQGIVALATAQTDLGVVG